MVLRRAVPLFRCALLAILLTGCGLGPLKTTTNPIGNSRYSGSVHGGQQPVAGATIQLYTVGYGANEDFTLSNTGNALLTIGRKTITPTNPRTINYDQYAFTNDNCLAPLAAGSSCTFALSPVPTDPISDYAGWTSLTLNGQIMLSDDASTGFGIQSASVADTIPAYLSQGSTVTGTVSFPDQSGRLTPRPPASSLRTS